MAKSHGQYRILVCCLAYLKTCTYVLTTTQYTYFRLEIARQYPHVLHPDTLDMLNPEISVVDTASPLFSHNISNTSTPTSSPNSSLNSIITKITQTLWNLLHHNYTHSHHNVAAYLYKVVFLCCLHFTTPIYASFDKKILTTFCRMPHSFTV